MGGVSVRVLCQCLSRAKKQPRREKGGIQESILARAETVKYYYHAPLALQRQRQCGHVGTYCVDHAEQRTTNSNSLSPLIQYMYHSRFTRILALGSTVT